MKQKILICAITLVIAGLLTTSTTSMGKTLIPSTTEMGTVLDDARSVLLSNQPPVAENDNIYIVANSTNNPIYVLSNDYDPEGDPLTIVSVTQPSLGISLGVVSIEGDHVLFTPPLSWIGGSWIGYGVIMFTYTITDGLSIPSHFVTATVYVTVVGYGPYLHYPGGPGGPYLHLL
ncbi:MAG: Ig-like domain-containing protein [Euryarchaeota archaeon]|nr:Ig-like domain-containing protein [Euryarchaeota archaeon]